MKKSTIFKRAELAVVLGSIMLIAIFSIVTRGIWLSRANLVIVVRIAAQLGIIAAGQALLIISREIDLSVGSVYAFAAVIYIILSTQLNTALSFPITLLIVLGIGFINGFLVLKVGIPSLITTLGSLYIFRGLVYYLTKGFGVSLPSGQRHTFLVNMLGGADIGGLSTIIPWFIGITIVMEIILERTKYGNHIYAVGGDPISASSQGISPIRTKWIAFLICSVLAGFAGIGTVSIMKMANTTLGTGLELESIASCVIGGVALTGGRGTIWGAAVGAFLLSTVRSGLILMGAPAYWFISFVGIALIAAAALNYLTQRAKGQRFGGI